ncbi:MAG: patatin-like phospholipase family protein [Cyclobacteriaceae bacterium]
MDQNRNIALVLSSGGARGLAHIGVIRALQENNYQISSVAGSSIGALVGAFHACGALDKYTDWVCNLDRMDVFNLVDFTFSVQGFVKGEKVFKELKKVIPDHAIEDMSIPFAAVTTDILSKTEVVMNSGSMYEAIRASTAIPTVIKPLQIGDANLIDGGVLNPIPVNRVSRVDGDLLLVSNVNANKPYKPKLNTLKAKEREESYLNMLDGFKQKWSKLLPGSKSPKEKLGYFELLNRSIDLMQDQLTGYLLDQYRPDMQVDISRDVCSTFEFYRAHELIDLGYQTCLETIELFESNQAQYED